MSTLPRTVPAHFVHMLDGLGPEKTLLIDREGEVTAGDLLADAAAAAEGLRKLGVKAGDRVGVYADNSRRWIVVDLAIQLARAVSVPRGTDTPAKEYASFLDHAGVGVVLAHAQRHVEALEALRDSVPTMGDVVAIDPKGATGRTVDDLIAEGRNALPFAEQAEAVRPEDLATIIYTSGTTGRPKGVMLTQSNFGHQIVVCPTTLDIGSQERFLSILPPWHIFERTVEYIALTQGCELVYTDRRRFKDDLGRYEPTFVPSVPRLWETVYDAVQKKLKKASPIQRAIFESGYAVARTRTRAWDRARGRVLRVHRPKGLGILTDGLVRLGALVMAAIIWLPDRLAHAVVFRKLREVTGGRLRGAISGGGLMPSHIDEFFHVIGVPILIGYGLTETSPVVTLRRPERNVLGTIGVVVPEVEIQIRNLDTGAPCAPGEKGVVFTRGPNVMQGYFRDEELTRTVIDEDGWFNTGDLGFVTDQGDLCFAGRAKETIVLRGGENVEPSSIEEAILASPLVEQVIVVGQDQKVLAALVVPDRSGIERQLGVDLPPERLASDPKVLDALREECRRRTGSLRSYERITRIALLPETLDVGNGCLTQTLKPRRHVIVERFADRIEEAYR